MAQKSNDKKVWQERLRSPKFYVAVCMFGVIAGVTTQYFKIRSSGNSELLNNAGNLWGVFGLMAVKLILLLIGVLLAVWITFSVGRFIHRKLLTKNGAERFPVYTKLLRGFSPLSLLVAGGWTGGWQVLNLEEALRFNQNLLSYPVGDGGIFLLKTIGLAMAFFFVVGGLILPLAIGICRFGDRFDAKQGIVKKSEF